MLKLPRRPRWVHRVIARVNGTAWMRCAGCDRGFGIHEDTNCYFVRNVPHMVRRRGNGLVASPCDGFTVLPSGGELTIGFDMDQFNRGGDRIVDFMLWQHVCPWCSDLVRGFYERYGCKPTLPELIALTRQPRNGPPSKPQSSPNGTAGIPGRA